MGRPLRSKAKKISILLKNGIRVIVRPILLILSSRKDGRIGVLAAITKLAVAWMRRQNGVSYYDAYAYCQASGGRLPTRSEWIAIAGGSEGRLYPWGNSFNSEGWPYLDPRLNAAQRCGLHKRDGFTSRHTQPRQCYIRMGAGY